MNAECPFCTMQSDRIVLENSVGMALSDSFPLTEGHTLVVPKRHVASIYELSAEEQTALWQLVASVREHLANEFAPDGFNIGLNEGVAAGQTILHAHIHIIPRRDGDVADPKGGIRWIIPERARYW